MIWPKGINMSQICIALVDYFKELSTNKISLESLSHTEAQRISILIYMHTVDDLRLWEVK